MNPGRKRTLHISIQGQDRQATKRWPDPADDEDLYRFLKGGLGAK